MTPEFFELVCDAPIPIDLGILRGLSKPCAMDLYIWLTLKQFWMAQRGRGEHTFTWEDIESQFSTWAVTTATQRRDFRNEVRDCLARIQELWPGLVVTPDAKKGVTVVRSAPSVASAKPLKNLQ